MSLALLVIGNGRLDYLHHTISAANQHLPAVSHRLMINDSGDPAVANHLDCWYPSYTHTHHPENLGMAKAVQAGFQAVLQTDADFVLWLEEDFRILAPLPLSRAIQALDTYPHVAQMLFQRQPLTPQEIETGSVVGAMGEFTSHEGWSEQRHIFSLNPCLIPRRTLEFGWPAGNEREMTDRLLNAGLSFGVWDGQLVEHIGESRAAAWQL